MDPTVSRDHPRLEELPDDIAIFWRTGSMATKSRKIPMFVGLQAHRYIIYIYIHICIYPYI
jgi:hypothetical protein